MVATSPGYSTRLRHPLGHRPGGCEEGRRGGRPRLVLMAQRALRAWGWRMRDNEAGPGVAASPSNPVQRKRM